MSAPIETGGPIQLGEESIDIFQAHAKREDLQRREARRERIFANLERADQEEASQAAQAAEAAPEDTVDPAVVDETAPADGRSGLAAGAGPITGENATGAIEQAKRVGEAAGPIAKSLVPFPAQVVGGMLDAIPQSVAAIRDVSAAMASFLPQVGIVFGGDELISIKRGDELNDVALTNKIVSAVEAVVPDIGPREGGGGEMARSMAQFITGFVSGNKLPGMKALGAMGKSGQISSAAIRGAVADFAVFDPHEARLADLLEQFPALRSPVTEYLASDPDDSAIEGRFKNAIEGLGLGVISEGLFAGVRAIAKARKAKAALEPVEAVTGELENLEKTVDIQKSALHDLLGDPEKPMFDVTPIEGGEVELARTLAEGGEDATARAAAAVPRGTKGEAGSEIMVNWARINTQDDVKALMQDTANLRAESIDSARRGKVTFKEIQLGAQEVDAFDALMNRAVNTGLSAEETFAVRELWGRSSRKLKDTIDLVRADPSDTHKIAFRKILSVHTMIQEQVLSVRAETARAHASWRMPAGDTVGFTLQMDQLKQLVSDYGTTEQLADKIGKLYDSGDLVAADKMVNGSRWARTADAIASLWYGSILSGPHTQMRNIISNTTVLPIQVSERRFAAFISQNGGSGEVFPEEAAAAIPAIFSGISDAFRISKAGRDLLNSLLEHPGFAADQIADNANEFGGFWRSLATGNSGFGIGKVDERNFGGFAPEKWGTSKESPIGSMLAMVDTSVSIPTRGLAAGDEIFKTANFRMELHDLAIRKAMAEIKAGTISDGDYLDRVTTLVNDPTESMQIMANRFAQESTFTQRLDPTSKMAGLLRGINRVPIIGKIVMPFVNVSYNLGRFAYQRTPIALGMQSYKDAIAQGGAAADIARSKMVLGSGLLALFADLAMQGRITGEGPSNPRERQQLRRMGWKPDSFVIGDPKSKDALYISIRGLEPIATSMGIAANTVEILAAAGDDDDTRLDELALATTFAIANQAVAANYMSSVSNFIEMMSDPTRKGEFFVNRLAGSAVPTAVATVTRAMDPVIREVEDMIDSVKSRTPGLSDGLPGKHDLHGRPLTRISGLGTAYDILSPLYASEWDPEPIDEELTRQESFIGNPKRSVSFGNVEIDLRDYKGAYQRYVKLAGDGITVGEFGENITAGPFFSDGGTRIQELNALVSGTHPTSDIYNQMTDGPFGGKVIMIKQIISAYQAAAKKELLKEFPEIRTEVNQKRFDKPGKFDFGIENFQDGFQ